MKIQIFQISTIVRAFSGCTVQPTWLKYCTAAELVLQVQQSNAKRKFSMVKVSFPLVWLATCLLYSEGLQPNVPSKDQSFNLFSRGRKVNRNPFLNEVSRLRLSEKSSESDSQKSRSLVVAIDDLGQSLKPVAQQAAAKSAGSTSTSQKILFSLQSYSCYTLFILYRAYRGTFILSPAIFRRVYAKIKEAMESDIVIDDQTTDTTSIEPGVSWRTKLTVSVLASIVTFSYLLGWFLRVVTSFLKTIAKTTSAFKSFEAAADELVEHESRVGKFDDNINGVNE